MKIRGKGEIKVLSNRSNLPKEGGRFYKKGDCLALWDANVEKRELISESMVSLPIRLHNKKEIHSWREDIGRI